MEIKPFEKKIWLSSPTMHGDEQKWVDEAISTNWVSTVGANINEIEKQIVEYVGCKYAVGLSCGTAALHMAIKLAGEKLYGMPKPNCGTLQGHKVFCSDMTFDATVNPVAYEDGEAVFIDTERDTWNMDPVALEKAFEIYPDVKLVVVAHLYGTPGKIDEIKAVCDKHGALIVEDAAESLGATYKGKQTGAFGDYGCISFNGNKIITGSSGGMFLNGEWVETGTLGDYNAISFNGNKVITGSAGGMFLTDSKEDADKVRKWSTQSREDAAWYQHEEIGYNYRISNIVAGIVRGQIPYLDEHIAQKKAIYERYKEGFKGLPVIMNPFDEKNSEPNYWLAHYNAEGRPIWKPMHMQPIYRMNPFITAQGNGRAKTNAYIAGSGVDVGADIFERGLCLPSDNKMTAEQQDKIIEVIRACFE